MRNPILNSKGVSLIAAVFIIVILGFMGVMFLSMINTGTLTSVNDLQSGQAFSIAEGGLERAVYRLKNGTSCNPAFPTNLNETNVLLGQGDFDIAGINYTDSTAVLSAGINNVDTIIPVTSSVNFAPMGRIMIESEIIDYHGISGNTLINAVRGVDGTTAVAHANTTPVAQDQCRITATGNPLANPVQRVVERNLQNPGAMMVYAKEIAGAGVITFSEAVRAAAGATGNVSVNWDTAVPIGDGGILLALKPAAGAPIYQGLSAIASSTGVDVTVTLPAHQANDILLLQVVVRDVDDTITWPAGWTQIAIPVDRGVTARYWWAWKRAASGAETNPLVDKSTATGDTYAAVVNYRGAIAVGDPWEVKGAPQTGAVDPMVLPGITTLSNNSLVVAAVAGEDNNNGTINTTGTNPLLYNEHYLESATVGNNIPFFRRWDGTRWGPEQQATAVGPGFTIHYMVLKFARTRNEAILGTLDSNGDIRAQVWDGNTNTWSATRLLADAGTATDIEYRSFDIEYETRGDRAIVVYKDVNGSADPDYVIWDGTNWSAATNINIATAGEVRWIELAPHPSSSEIVMIALNSNDDVCGMRWPGGGAAGAAWSDMGVAGVWDASAANSGSPAMAPSKVMDVAYEQQLGRAMFIWGDATATDSYYRIWDGAVLSAANILLDIPAMGDEADWVRLVARSNSNELIYGVQDGARNLNTRLWNGAAWDTAVQHPEHDGSTEDSDHRNFDIVFETHPNNAGQAWLVWGEGATVRQNRWNGANWVGSAAIAGGDDTGLVQLVAHPASGAIFAGIYEDSASGNDDFSEMHLVNGGQAWPGYVDMWTGPTAGDPVMEKVFIAAERYVPNIGWREVYP